MTRRKPLIVSLFAAIALFACMVLGLPLHTDMPRAPMQNAARQTTPDGKEHSDITLFPNLCSASIRAISIRTPERSFQFQLDSLGAVSVNGAQADKEIFATLVDQIADLPVDPFGAFPADGTQLMMTLEVLTDGRRHTAHFYEDGASGIATHIICGTPDAPEYRLTEGWRVGTLVMTCEGTRIQDAHGNETPLQLSI